MWVSKCARIMCGSNNIGTVKYISGRKIYILCNTTVVQFSVVPNAILPILILTKKKKFSRYSLQSVLLILILINSNYYYSVHVLRVYPPTDNFLHRQYPYVYGVSCIVVITQYM